MIRYRDIYRFFFRMMQACQTHSEQSKAVLSQFYMSHSLEFTSVYFNMKFLCCFKWNILHQVFSTVVFTTHGAPVALYGNNSFV